MLFRRIIYLAVAASAIAATWFQLAFQNQKSTRLPLFKPVPDFQLVERSGKTVTLGDLKGKVWLAVFFYASCPGPCPVVSGRLGALQDELFKNNRDVRLVSISTQPDEDTPEVLRHYAARFHASDKWLFLTGDKAQIYALANKGFLLTAVEQNGFQGNPVIHSTKLALVDRAGNIRGYYDGTDEANTAQILHDVNALAEE